MDEFSGNRSSSYPEYDSHILQKLNRYTQKMMDEFSRNRFSSWAGNTGSKKYWMSFPEIRLCLKTEISEKIPDGFSRICQ